VHQNYALDVLDFKLGGVDDGVMRFSRASAGTVGVTGRLRALARPAA
jgi:hypothetical protein